MSIEFPPQQQSNQTKSISKKELVSRTTGRPSEFYEQFLIIDPQEFDNKRILNIGAGRSDLNTELEEKNIHPELLINLDLAYKNVGESHGLMRKISGKGLDKDDIPKNAVAADMKKLPLADNSIDQVLCLWSIGWLPTIDQTKAIQEAFRVCKKERGEIKIYPAQFSKKALKLIKKYPFLKLTIPKTDIRKLFASATQKKTTATKINQYFSNVDSIIIDKFNQLLEAGRGKSVGTLTIRKEADLDQKTINLALEDLIKNGGLIF